MRDVIFGPPKISLKTHMKAFEEELEWQEKEWETNRPYPCEFRIDRLGEQDGYRFYPDTGLYGPRYKMLHWCRKWDQKCTAPKCKKEVFP